MIRCHIASDVERSFGSSRQIRSNLLTPPPSNGVYRGMCVIVFAPPVLRKEGKSTLIALADVGRKHSLAEVRDQVLRWHFTNAAARQYALAQKAAGDPIARVFSMENVLGSSSSKDTTSSKDSAMLTDVHLGGLTREEFVTGLEILARSGIAVEILPLAGGGRTIAFRSKKEEEEAGAGGGGAAGSSSKEAGAVSAAVMEGGVVNCPSARGGEEREEACDASEDNVSEQAVSEEERGRGWNEDEEELGSDADDISL